MAYDVSIERTGVHFLSFERCRTPEMVAAGKDPGVNLNNARLNEEGKPHRVCVVIRSQTEDERRQKNRRLVSWRFCFHVKGQVKRIIYNII